MQRHGLRRRVLGWGEGVILKSLLSNNVFSVTATLTLLVAGTYQSLHAENFQWLSRFGALVICVGIMTMARPFVTGRPLRINVKMETGFDWCDKKHYQTLGEHLPDWFRDEMRDRAAVGWLGPIIYLVGTGTNGFADLLNGYFSFV
jgi:hypothetical protein